MIASEFRLTRVGETLHLAITESLSYHSKTSCCARVTNLLGGQPSRCDMNLPDLDAIAGFLACSSGRFQVILLDWVRICLNLGRHYLMEKIRFQSWCET
jgi:hypothetical protein